MLKKISLIIVFALFINSLSAQKKVIPNNPDYQYQSGNETTQQTIVKQYTKPTFQPRWSYGGNIGMSFWNGGTDIFLAPKAYYHLSPKFITGVGVTYIYSDGEYLTNSIGGLKYINYHSNSFGGGISALYRPIPFLQFSAEYEGLQTEWRGAYADSYWNNAIYLGASFITGNFSFGVRYDVLYDNDKSVYGDAWTPFIGFYF